MQADRISITIRKIRFPLILLIVLIHCRFNGVIVGGAVCDFTIKDYPLYSNVSYYISKYICGIGVPLFGLLSGFLYFFNVGAFTKEVYLEKTKRRVKTLLVPYLLWNIIILLIYFVGQQIMPSMGGDRMLIKNYTWIDFLNVFWGIDEGCPMCFQFWFLRDLIIVSLLSPIVYLIAKKWRFLVLALLALWFFDYKIPLPGLNSSVITFFTLGAFFSLNKMTDKDVPQSSFNIFVILYFVLLAIEVALYNTNLSDTICFHLIYKVGVLIGVFVFPLYYYFYHYKNVNSFLEKGSFFVYAAHGVLVSIFTRLLLSAIPVNSDLRALGVYFLIPVLSVSVCLLSFYILKRFLPKFTSILTGGKI